MPQYLDENGNPIAAPAKVYLDDNGEPIQSGQAKPTVTPTLGAVLRPLTNRERFETTYPVGVPGESVGENIKNTAQNVGVGMWNTIAHPLNTVGGMIKSVIPAPVEEKLFGTNTPNPVKGIYDIANTKDIPAAAQAVGQTAVLAGLADAVPTPKGTSTTIPRVLRPLVEKTREAQKAATESTDEYANAIKQKTGEIAADQSEKSKAAKAKGIEQERTHQKSVEDTKAANKAAIREQEKIAPTKEKLQKSVQEMQAQVETARNNALKEGNKKYSAVNAALNHISADPEFMQGALADSLEAIKGTSTEPTILKDMMRKGERGEVATYEDLQGYYSELGTELSKGNVPGDLYHAYDTIHEAIGDEMQRIADANGQGPQLKAARDYWRRMKQAFGKPYNPTDVANVVLDKTAGSVMRQAEQANRLRLLGSFDKTIPQTAEHISNLQKGIEALPKEHPLRSILKPLPEKPAPVSPPKFEGSPEELAKQQTKLPKPVGKTVIDRADIEEAKRGKLAADADNVASKGKWGATVLSLYALRGFLHGDFSGAAMVPYDVAGAMAVTHGIAQIMRRPSVVEFFTKATAKDIASIPPELRGDLPQLVSAARKSGVKVSPAIAAAAGAASGSQKTPGDLLRQSQ